LQESASIITGVAAQGVVRRSNPAHGYVCEIEWEQEEQILTIAERTFKRRDVNKKARRPQPRALSVRPKLCLQLLEFCQQAGGTVVFPRVLAVAVDSAAKGSGNAFAEFDPELIE